MAEMFRRSGDHWRRNGRWSRWVRRAGSSLVIGLAAAGASYLPMAWMIVARPDETGDPAAEPSWPWTKEP